ncbi:MAG TPA: GTP cyclohydrolase II [Kofleriaceae bacterium]|nr:GTP cyclohydrolase II [Kofleriaceae bacterium]
MGLSSSSARAESEAPFAVLRSESELSTENGLYRFLRYESAAREEAFAIVMGDLAGSDPAFVRVHSECLTGEVFSSLKCDCRDQLEQAMLLIAERGRGAVVYLRQEGRGIGLGNKIRAYALQARGADTIEANHELGFPTDLREFDLAAAILRDLGATSVILHTNNPEKVQALEENGIAVVSRAPAYGTVNQHNRDYLETKHRELGHDLGTLLALGGRKPDAP